MPKQRSWTDKDLERAVKDSRSFRSVLYKLGLIPAGGNYDHVKRITGELKISTEHFTGQVWNKGMKYELKNKIPIEQLLINDTNSKVQSYKLKNRLFNSGLKKPACELCGWCKKSADGRIPVELDHINGNKLDNRLENLRVLCPNCYSLQATHRGKNKKVKLARVVERYTRST